MEQRLSRNFIRKIKMQVLRALDIYDLDPADYVIEFKEVDKDNPVLLSVSHRKYPRDIFYIIETSPSFRDAKFLIAPGPLLNIAQLTGKLDDLEPSLDRWCPNVVGELSALKDEENDKNANLIKDKIAPHLQKCVTNPKEFFTNDEVDIIANRLDSLEEQLKEFKTKLHLTEKNLAELHEVINEIKELSESEVQEQWLDKTLNKFTSWAGRLDKLEKIARTVEKGVDWLDKLPPM
ncbi:hypothetical protein [Vibrio mediterranei]|uniref:Uncharacterized protein n=1 Tax=Vibrio mediterranei TaxID=689 RepID=A0A3G4V520_9VIBR|nr:hypothetical protein [Vibrio mediterranei]AYV19863.1 hypothetical protein ECB94_00510 [Vibrio mediterranei]